MKKLSEDSQSLRRLNTEGVSPYSNYRLLERFLSWNLKKSKGG
jgi:hypothetical protein